MRIFSLTMAILTFSSSAFATELTSIQGPVLVNIGKGFRQVSEPTQVKEGTSVMASPKGSAEIVYTDGCSVPVKDGIVVVEPVSPCAQGADLRLPPPSYSVQQPVQTDYLGYGIGALALGGGIGIGCAIWCRQPGQPSVTVIVPVSP